MHPRCRLARSMETKSGYQPPSLTPLRTYQDSENARKAAENARRAVEMQKAFLQAKEENGRLQVQLKDLEAVLGQLSGEAEKGKALAVDQQAMKTALDRSQLENQRLRESIRQSEKDVHHERQRRESAEVECAQLNAEKQRLQTSKDQLTAQLRLSDERAREAEEEQCKAEEEAATIRREISHLHHSNPEAPRVDTQLSLQQELDLERSRTDGLSSALEKCKCDYQNVRVELKHALSKIEDLQKNGKAEKSVGSNPEGHEGHQSPTEDPPSPSSKSNSNQGSDLCNEADLHSLRDQVANMTRKATVYKSSRDKLLLELNCQSIDIDGLQADNDAMQHELVDTKKLARYWQHQANEALAQMERLKEMLEESAKWPKEEAGDVSKPSDQHQLEKENVRVATLDFEVRKLKSEVAEAVASNQSIRRSWLPVLRGIESSLTNLLMTGQRATG